MSLCLPYPYGRKAGFCFSAFCVLLFRYVVSLCFPSPIVLNTIVSLLPYIVSLNSPVGQKVLLEHVHGLVAERDPLILRQ